MLRVRVYDNGKCLEGDESLLGTPGITWVDLLEPDEATLMRLGERFGLHRLAIEDCLHLDQRPKLEDFGTHQFVVLQGFTSSSDSWDELTMHEMHFFLGKDWVISVHQRAHEAVDQVHQKITAEPASTIGKGPDVVLYLLVDALVDRHFPLLDCFNDELENFEDRIFEQQPTPKTLQDLFKLKRALVTVRRVLSPQRDVIAFFARGGVPQVQEKTTLYFRDIYDHLVRIYEQIEAARDLVGNVVEGYLSQVANRTAEISKQLTLFASIFLPLSFVVGFFGQNFDVLSAKPFFFVMLASMVVLPAGTLLWFRHRNWL